MRLPALLWAGWFLATGCAAGGDDGVTRPDARDDSGDVPEGGPDVDADPVDDGGETPTDVVGDGPPCTSDRQCDDYDPCNGIEACLGGFCASGRSPCDDGLTCTTDTCRADASGFECGHIFVHSACPEFMICRPDVGCIEIPCTTSGDCDNGNDCDGRETCAPAPINLCRAGLPIECAIPGAVSRCVLGECIFVECLPRRWDVDGDIRNGCEVECDRDPRGVPDEPDDAFLDANCDGIDGAVADGVFVAQDGSPANPGTRDFPLSSINDGIRTAADRGLRFVYVSAGTYNEAVALRDGIQVHGGYLRASRWARDGTRATIRGPSTGAVVADGIRGGALLEYVRIESADALLPGRSSHAVVLADSSGVRLRHSDVIAGAGALGLPGASAGSRGADGGNGVPGPNGYEDDSYFYCAGNAPDPPAYQLGGAPCTGAANNGGNGGRACKTNSGRCPGDPGGVGGTDGATGGSGGVPVSGGVGGSGARGTDGARGSNGGGGTAGTIVGREWAPRAGENGRSGQNGGGGGGGAGGGSNHSSGTCNDWGGGGGSGGGGGCGGGGGEGGGGGGASIGILLLGGTLDVEFLRIQASAGGNGGAGRDGGRGGEGGLGRAGGMGYDEGRAGGAGGDGGRGGEGGAGGGGAGGDSWCAYRHGGAAYNSDPATTCRPGAPGLGGSSSGNAGANGTPGTVF